MLTFIISDKKLSHIFECTLESNDAVYAYAKCVFVRRKNKSEIESLKKKLKING